MGLPSASGISGFGNHLNNYLVRTALEGCTSLATPGYAPQQGGSVANYFDEAT
jgi:hypothetical protein